MLMSRKQTRFCNNYHFLCVSLAASGDLEALEIWSLAGADLNKAGYDGNTAIEVVGSEGRWILL